MDHKLDVRKIVDDLCGSKHPASISQRMKIELLVKRMNKCGLNNIKVRGVEKWIDKGTIAGPRLVDLAILAASCKIRLNIYRYILNSENEPLYPGER